MRRLEQRQAAGPGALQLPVRQGTVSERFRRAETPQAWGIQIAFIQRSGPHPLLVSRLLIQCINITYLFYWLTTDFLIELLGNDSNLLIVFYVQIMPDDFVMQLHR
nr:hypothetical protein [Escherichia coli]MDM8863790.1 hypothetical protein [Escherichia coli]MDM8868713.1 hypothetical protein [Escherichia coli]